jgi:signal transduction histidine kinase
LPLIENNSKLKTQNSKLKTQNSKLKTQNSKPKTPMTLTLRLTLTYLVLTLAGLLLLGGGFLTLTSQYLAQRGEQELAIQVDVAAGLLAELATTPTELQALATSELVEGVLPEGTRARIFTPAGALISGDPQLGPFPSRPALALINSSFPLPASQVAERRYVARPIGNSSAPLGILELSRSRVDEQFLLTTLRNLGLQAAALVALIVVIASYLLARSISQPVLRLARRAEHMAQQLELAKTKVYVQQEVAPRSKLKTQNSELKTLTTSLDQLEAQLQAYTTQINELSQARIRLLRNVSHELRTPLTAISGTAENLRDVVPPQQQEALATIEREAGRLARLVDALLNPAADGKLPMEWQSLDLSALVDELCASQQSRARRAGVALRATMKAQEVQIRGDRDRLKQALLNLLDNALRATPPGGQIVVELNADQAWAELRVRDTGPGVPPELRERIWERGFSGSEGGAGLGLAIVHEIITAHRGEVFLGDQGSGAEFVIRLPARDPRQVVA